MITPSEMPLPYINSLVRRYNEVQILGMREPVPLKSLFVRVNILEKISANTRLVRREDLLEKLLINVDTLRNENLNQLFDYDMRNDRPVREAVDGEMIVNKLTKFIVLGKPGAGKTTYLKYLALMMIDSSSQIKQRKLPIFITLREWADTRKPLMNFIIDQFDISGLEQADTYLENMLREGDCFVLFDGLDEVSENVKQGNIIQQIKNFSDKYPDNQIVVSCRIAAYNHWLTGFTEVEMADFNVVQMERFIRNWFNSEPIVAKECWERLKSSPPLRELASVPLLLTLLCLEYGESNDFPPNRSELYRRAIDTLLTKWDSTRRIRRQEVYKKLSNQQKESMFARIAFGTFLENQYFIDERDLTRMIKQFIEHLPYVKEDEAAPDSIIILKAIEAHHGIFVERAKEIYSFAHLTFQEYFTAKYIVDHTRVNSLENLVELHLYKPRWTEVFKLVAGLLDSTDELLWMMRKKTELILEMDDVNQIMKIAEKSTYLREDGYPSSIRRGYFIALALHRINVKNNDNRLGVAHARALEVVSSLARAFDKPLGIAPSLNLDFHLLDEFGKTLNIKEASVVQILNYLSANLLILQCLNSANYVSKPIREKMLHEICLPRRD